MRVVGIDTSLTSTGVAIVDAVSCTTTRVESKPPKRAKGDKSPATIDERRTRIWKIRNSIGEAIRGTSPALAVVEAPSYGSQGGSTWDRAWLWGSVIDDLIGDMVPVAIIAPRCRALWAAGSGAASKSPIAVHMSRMWPNVSLEISDDEWDAISLASMGAQKLGIISVELQRHRDQLEKVSWPHVWMEAAS